MDLCHESDWTSPDCKWTVAVVYLIFNVLLIAIAAVLVLKVEPAASGSGIPEVKCLLNGVRMPHAITLRTLLVKTVDVALAVGGGLIAGKVRLERRHSVFFAPAVKEGPMIHCGAIVGSLVPKVFKRFLPDSLAAEFGGFHKAREFVSAGTAAGVAAAFGAPLGGVLLSLEEVAGLWKGAHVWHMVASFEEIRPLISDILRLAFRYSLR